MLGAHLDSVEEGPGRQRQRIRLAGAARDRRVDGQAGREQEEREAGPDKQGRVRVLGRRGGRPRRLHLLRRALPKAQRADIMANLNFDMLASPNFARLVYDGDGDPRSARSGPEGSDVIEHIFNALLRGPRAFANEVDGVHRSLGCVPFIEAGIPAGGLFMGAEAPKTAAQVERYGGVAGAWLRTVPPPGVRHAGHAAAGRPWTRTSRGAARRSARRGGRRARGATAWSASTRWPCRRPRDVDLPRGLNRWPPTGLDSQARQAAPTRAVLPDGQPSVAENRRREPSGRLVRMDTRGHSRSPSGAG